jgi:S1-C subfamily serine protease
MLEQATTQAASVAGPSVVKIESAGGLGAGVIVDKRGYLVTNYHVLGGARGEAAPEGRYTVTLANGRSYRATIIGTDAPDDLAVLKITAPRLHALPPANSHALRVGQFVLAVENGMLIGGVEPQGPADRASLRTGDVIVRLDGRPTRSEAAFGDVLARLRPGERVAVTVVGQGGERTVTVTLVGSCWRGSWTPGMRVHGLHTPQLLHERYSVIRSWACPSNRPMGAAKRAGRPSPARPSIRCGCPVT